MKDRLQQRRVKEIIQEVAKIEVPVPEVRLAEVPVATPSSAKEKKKVDSETKAASFEPSSARKSDRKKKEPSPEPEEEEELTVGTRSSKEDAELEEEPSTPPPEPKARMGMHSIDKKKLPLIYKSLAVPKQPTKMPQKGEVPTRSQEGSK